MSVVSYLLFKIFLEEDSMYTLVIIKLQKATVIVKSSEVDRFFDC